MLKGKFAVIFFKLFPLAFVIVIHLSLLISLFLGISIFKFFAVSKLRDYKCDDRVLNKFPRLLDA